MNKIQIDEKLTPENSSKKKQKWFRDEEYSENSKASQIYFLECEVDRGIKLGKPKNGLDEFIGLYEESLNISLPEIDYSLTPVNAKKKGFVWVGDSIIDPEAPDIANLEFVNLYKDGYRFGEPASLNSITHGAVGIFEPLKNRHF